MKKPTLNMTRGLAATVRGMRRCRYVQTNSAYVWLSTCLISWRGAALSVPGRDLVAASSPQEEVIARLLFACEHVAALRGARDVVLSRHAVESNLTRRGPR